MRAIATTVRICELTIEGHVGVGAAERDGLQKLLVDLECMLADADVCDDDLRHSADYVPIVDAVRTLCVRKKRRLIETLAQEIAEVCFRQPRVREVRVGIRKPRKLVGCTAVGVTRVFVKGDAS